MIRLQNIKTGEESVRLALLSPVTPETLADLAVLALVEEARLPMKPGLVGPEGAGAHLDMNLELMLISAMSLRPAFLRIAQLSWGKQPSVLLRETLGRIGREGENTMFAATGGVNTHKGALWSLGLLTAGAAMAPGNDSAERVAGRAGVIARLPDKAAPKRCSNGFIVKQKYGAAGAIGAAQSGFAQVRNSALPMLRKARASGRSENEARLDALLLLMTVLDDTCILHRGGMRALRIVKAGAFEVLEAGGSGTTEGKRRLLALGQSFPRLNLSPGGSADLLAATLFLDAFVTTTGGLDEWKI